MLVAVARAKKDAKALSHAVNCEVLSLGGVRSAEDLDLSMLDKKIPIFFFGRDEIELALEVEEKIRKVTPIYQIVILSKKAVRNTRMEEIREAFEMAKAKLRLGFNFDGDVFLFSNKNELGVEIHPDYDAYFVVGDGFVENTREVFGVDVEEGNLIVRKLFNEEWIYTPELKAVISKKIGESLSVKLHRKDVESKKISISKMIEKNRAWLERLEEIAIDFIQKNVKGSVGVPFSGGKDSTATLILAKKALDDVKALYVKVSHEMPYTEEYVQYICEKLDVDVVKSNVFFDVERFGVPTHSNRWCTKLKMEGLQKIATQTLIVGDREAESKIRRERPEVMERVAREIFPIKYWSGCAVQLYILMNGLELHPLYYEGFYRLGCTICPSLSDWECLLLKKFGFSRF
jgi:3'-phosphoadenosine 5'-phosphosulfate sulfotransferase (PAPS reductase)/FAD synthetase/3'-phosphoadenosine 5'-phosphosulfate sulfotransferase